jgi:hypothetical protein
MGMPLDHSLRKPGNPRPETERKNPNSRISNGVPVCLPFEMNEDMIAILEPFLAGFSLFDQPLASPSPHPNIYPFNSHHLKV